VLCFLKASGIPLKGTTSGRPNHILPVIVLAQFCGTSLWFAGNAVMEDLSQVFGLPMKAAGDLTSAVQLGFIAGTLIFAILTLADRFSPRVLFLFCAFFGALFNSFIFLFPFSYFSILSYRFITGIFLAGIYPVGMKIAADWYPESLGKALGYLVGALVLGTGFPHLVRSIGADVPWSMVVLIVSIVSLAGGILLYCLVPDGPWRVKASEFRPSIFLKVFRIPEYRSAAFGYFGHMWELYAFWTFLPLILLQYVQSKNGLSWDVSLLSFLVIGSGFLGCSLGGLVSIRSGSSVVAFTHLSISGICCFLSLFSLHIPPGVFLIWLFIWGVTVVGDSPQYSALIVRSVQDQWIGTALTIANCIGFSITIISIQLVKATMESTTINKSMIWVLPGPVLGLISLLPLLRKKW